MTGLHQGNIYTSSGQVVVHKDFVGETESGWQCTPLGANEYTILKDTTYTVAVFMPGKYVRTPSYFGSPRSNNGYLTALADNSWWSETNVAQQSYPSVMSGSRSNYWVDIEFEPAGVSGPWEMTVTNASAAGAKCTLITDESPIADDNFGAVLVTVAPGWKAAFTGTCGPGFTLIEGNEYSFTTERMTADCGVTVTCSEKQVPLWIAP
jgi:hypothetical protein